MSSRAQYLLKIGGRLQARKTKDLTDALVKDLKKDLAVVFKNPGPGTGAFKSKPGAGWPEGFVLAGYKVCQWDVSVDRPFEPSHPDDEKAKEGASKTKDPWPEDVMVTFRGEIHRSHEGSLFLNRHSMIPDVQWFYHYRYYLWHSQLKQELGTLNKKYAPDLIERIWFRDWQWYCGNSGC